VPGVLTNILFVVVLFPKHLTRHTFFFFSAALFYPGRCGNNVSTLFTPILPNSEHLSTSDEGDTDIESEEDWLTEPLLGELAMRNASKASDMMLGEVSLPFFFLSLVQVLTTLSVAANLA